MTETGRQPKRSHRALVIGPHKKLSPIAIAPIQAVTKNKRIKWEHFDILVFGKTDYHCKVKETLFIQELQQASNVNVSSEKLLLY